MNEITINIEWIKWGLLILIIGNWFYQNTKSREPGMMSGLDMILPTFITLVFIIIWLLIFFIIL